MPTRLLPVFCLFPAVLMAQVAEGPPARPVAEMESLIASYPKSLWEPMLLLSAHPVLLERLAANKGLVQAPNQPAEVQKALQTLAQYPEIAKVMHEDRGSMMAIGRAYATDKQKVLGEIARQAEIESKATDDWSKRLSQDPEAADQLATALKAYQQQPNANLSASDAAAEAGATVSDNTVNVTSLPSPGFSEFIMSNADTYPALADTMVSQWLGGRNTWAYERTFNHWWDHFHHAFHDEHFFHNDEHRADRLADAARYDRKYHDDEHRWDHFGDHRGEYQHLGRVNKPPADRKAQPGRKPHVPGGGEHHARLGNQGSHHHTVKRGHGSEAHHAHHAAAAHHHAGRHGGGHRR